MPEMTYETPSLTRDQADAMALTLLRSMQGIPVSIVRQVLKRADFWIDALTVLECGPATEFARAFEALQRAADESP